MGLVGAGQAATHGTPPNERWKKVRACFCYSRALELLEEWGIQLNERGGFGGDFTSTDSDSDGADAEVAAATSKRRRAN